MGILVSNWTGSAKWHTTDLIGQWVRLVLVLSPSSLSQSGTDGVDDRQVYRSSLSVANRTGKDNCGAFLDVGLRQSVPLCAGKATDKEKERHCDIEVAWIRKAAVSGP